MSITIYGIKNCNSMKRTFAWFDQHRLGYGFHDYKQSGIDPTTLTGWCRELGWEVLINTRGTTWRKLDPASQRIGGEADAVALMVQHPSLIKRPVVRTADGHLLVGFDAAALAARLGSGAST